MYLPTEHNCACIATCTRIATALCSYTTPLQGEAGLPGNLSCLIAGAAHIIIGTSHMYPVVIGLEEEDRGGLEEGEGRGGLEEEEDGRGRN